MQVSDYTIKNTFSTESDPAAAIEFLQSSLEAAQDEIAALKQQLEWFKRQLFGRKSEKRLIENPDQLDFAALLGDTPEFSESEPSEKITYTRRKPKQRREPIFVSLHPKFRQNPE